MEKTPIHTIFEHNVWRFSEKVAVDEGSRSVTYQELNARANRVAHALAELEVDTKSIIGIYFEASIEYVTAALRVLKAGAIFMPMNTRFPDERLISILNKTEPEVFITRDIWRMNWVLS